MSRRKDEEERMLGATRLIPIHILSGKEGEATIVASDGRWPPRQYIVTLDQGTIDRLAQRDTRIVALPLDRPVHCDRRQARNLIMRNLVSSSWKTAKE